MAKQAAPITSPNTAPSDASGSATATGSPNPGACPVAHGPPSKDSRPWPLVTKDKPKKPKAGILATLSKLRVQSKRPLPSQFGNGTYAVTQQRPGRKTELQTLKGEGKSTDTIQYGRTREDTTSNGSADWKTLWHLVMAKVKGTTLVDDKTMMMERLIRLVAGLPHRSMLREKLTNKLIATLWNSLEHPPMLYVGDLYRYRSPDGSKNVCLRVEI